MTAAPLTPGDVIHGFTEFASGRRSLELCQANRTAHEDCLFGDGIRLTSWGMS